MKNILQIKMINPEQMNILLDIWEGSVRSTHQFLTETDITALKPQVQSALLEIESLYIYVDGSIKAFIGIEDRKIEMLFVSPAARGAGIGKALLQFALAEMDVCYVDVNEQNPQAIGFYQHLGFVLDKRSEMDGQGNPFPILHLKIADKI